MIRKYASLKLLKKKHCEKQYLIALKILCTLVHCVFCFLLLSLVKVLNMVQYYF